jgi:beta-carotene hydroxylase
MRNNTGSIIRYKADFYPVLLICFIIFLGLLPVYFPLSVLTAACLWLAIMIIKPVTSFIQHNHVHIGIFRQKWLNFLFDLLIALATGYGSPEWELQHNIGHHRNTNSAKDPASVIHPKTGKLMSRWHYVFYGSITIFIDSYKIALAKAKSGNNKYLYRLFTHLFFQVLLLSMLMFKSFAVTMIFFVIPNVISRGLVWWGSYWHHLDVPNNTVYDSANTCTDNFFNRISFNSGFHATHHEKPTLHWSLLPERTEVIWSKIPETCIYEKLP